MVIWITNCEAAADGSGMFVLSYEAEATAEPGHVIVWSLLGSKWDARRTKIEAAVSALSHNGMTRVVRVYTQVPPGRWEVLPA